MLSKRVKRRNTTKKNIKDDPFYSEANQARLRKSIKEMEETGGTIHDIDLDA